MNGDFKPSWTLNIFVQIEHTCYDKFNSSMIARGYELTNFQLVVNWVKL